MIAALKGRILFRDTNRVVVDVAGVGYEVAISSLTMASLPEDGEVFFHVHTALRENSLELYGFSAAEEKTLFEMLLGVTGIGPRLALGILSGISADAFEEAVMRGDVGRLTAIPGIGKKSGERIILELKEKIKKKGIRGLTQSGVDTALSVEEDLVSSLLNLGYKERDARSAARNVLTGSDRGLSLGAAVKAALKELAT